MRICNKPDGGEIQMKKWKRLWKLSEIEQLNPDWKDLYPTLLEGS